MSNFMSKKKSFARIFAMAMAMMLCFGCFAVSSFAAGKTVKLNYYDEVNGTQAAEIEITLEKATAESVSKADVNANMPKGFELNAAEKDSYDIGSGGQYVYIGVKPASKQTVKLNYYDEANKVQAAEVAIDVAANATRVGATKIEAPEGYKVVSSEYTIRDGYVYIAVENLPAAKEVKLNYFDEEAYKQVEEIVVTVAGNAEKVAEDVIKKNLPAGYEITGINDYVIRDGYVYVGVKQAPTTKTVKLNYFDQKAYKQVSEVEMEVPANAEKVAATKIEAPEGYKIVWSTCDFVIRDGYVYVEVEKIEDTEATEPTDPSTPADPQDPAGPSEEPGNADQPADTEQPAATEEATDDAAQTGDDFNMMPFAIAMALAAVAGTATVAYKRRSSH